MAPNEGHRSDLDELIDGALASLTAVDARRMEASRLRTLTALQGAGVEGRPPRGRMWPVMVAGTLIAILIVFARLSRPGEEAPAPAGILASRSLSATAPAAVSPASPGSRAAAAGAALAISLPPPQADTLPPGVGRGRERRAPALTIDDAPLVPLASIAPGPLDAPPPVEVDVITIDPLAPDAIVVEPITIGPVDAPGSPR